VANRRKRGLGRGLGALISTINEVDAASASLAEGARGDGSTILQLDPKELKPNPKQPRMSFGEETLEELAESIKQDGVQEPVIVRKGDDGYELVSGERRVRACVIAGLETVPAICREVSDDDMLRLGLIENIHREDLNAIELANAYQMLLDEFGCTQEELAAAVGKKRATVTNTLRLLHLPGDVQQRVVDGSISMGHARALLALDTPEAQSAACMKIISQGLSVRQAEKLAASPKPRKSKKKTDKDADVALLEDDLRRQLGTKVTVRQTGKHKGKIEIEYYSLDDLERILDRLRSSR